MKDFISLAEEAANTHHFSICDKCRKRCKTTCLPLEMFRQLYEEEDISTRLFMLDNAESEFVDDL